MALNKKLVILVFIDWYVPGYRAGGPIQSLVNLTHHLSNDFEFLIVTRNTDYQSEHAYSDIKTAVWIKRENVYVQYLSAEEVTAGNIKRIIKESNYDLLYINGIFSFYFSILPLLIGKKFKKKIIVSSRGMLAPGALSLKAFKKKIFLAFMKLGKFYKNVRFHATNFSEKEQIIKNIAGNVEVTIVPNLPKPNRIAAALKISKKRGEIKILSVARIAPEKNLLFALQCLKEIKGQSVNFNVYGPVYDSEYFEKCKQLAHSFSENIAVNFKGSVESDKIEKIIVNHHLLFLPTLGENFGHIIIETLRCGRPVLISDQTPWVNLKENNLGMDLPLDQKEKYLDFINTIANHNEEEFNKYCKGVYHAAGKLLNLEENIEQYHRLFSIPE